jgi:hypothetical protein
MRQPNYCSSNYLARHLINHAYTHHLLNLNFTRLGGTVPGMAGTVFTASLEGMKSVKSENGVILTKPFLEVCKLILPVLGALLNRCSPSKPYSVLSHPGQQVFWLTLRVF